MLQVPARFPFSWWMRQPGGPATPVMSSALISTARRFRIRLTRSVGSCRGTFTPKNLPEALGPISQDEQASEGTEAQRHVLRLGSWTQRGPGAPKPRGPAGPAKGLWTCQQEITVTGSVPFAGFRIGSG